MNKTPTSSTNIVTATKTKLLSNPEFYTMFEPKAMFEPKVDHRFVVKATDSKTNETLIPTFLIKSTSIPSFSYNWYGGKKYEPLILKLYNPIVPSATQIAYDIQNKKFNINIAILGPFGDNVEEWDIYNATIKSIKLSSYDWSNNADVNIITLEFKIKDVRFLY